MSSGTTWGPQAVRARDPDWALDWHGWANPILMLWAIGVKCFPGHKTHVTSSKMPCLLNSLNIWSSFKADKCLNRFWSFHLNAAPPALKLHSKPIFFPQCPLFSQVWGRTAHSIQSPFFHSLQSAGPLPWQGAKADGTHLASQHHSDIYCSTALTLLDAFDIL